MFTAALHPVWLNLSYFTNKNWLKICLQRNKAKEDIPSCMAAVTPANAVPTQCWVRKAKYKCRPIVHSFICKINIFNPCVIFIHFTITQYCVTRNPNKIHWSLSLIQSWNMSNKYYYFLRFCKCVYRYLWEFLLQPFLLLIPVLQFFDFCFYIIDFAFNETMKCYEHVYNKLSQIKLITFCDAFIHNSTWYSIYVGQRNIIN